MTMHDMLRGGLIAYYLAIYLVHVIFFFSCKNMGKSCVQFSYYLYIEGQFEKKMTKQLFCLKLKK